MIFETKMTRRPANAEITPYNILAFSAERISRAVITPTIKNRPIKVNTTPVTIPAYLMVFSSPSSVEFPALRQTREACQF
jgi:hypothetical protein